MARAEAEPTLRHVTAILAIVLLAAATLAAGLSLPTEPAPPEEWKSIGQLIHEQRHAHAAGTHPLRLDEPVADPVTRAETILLDEDFHGRSAMAWARLADADRLLALKPDAQAERDLAAEVLRLHAATGLVADADVRASLQAQADALPEEVRAPFARLVGAVADSYHAQLPIANAILADWPRPVDMDHPILDAAQREATLVNGERIVAAQNAFRAATSGLWTNLALPEGPLFQDPLGLVVLGGLGNDAYGPNAGISGLLVDPILLVDPAGDDEYRTSAGGACPDPLGLAHECNGLVVSVNVDLGGNDLYAYDGAPAAVQGAGSVGGVGILVDALGDDTYYGKMTRTNSGPLFMYIDGGMQGFSQGGYGLLLDAAGADTYDANVQSATGRSIYLFGQGFGSAGGVGIAADAGGDDRWVSHGLGIPRSGGFQGVYTDGVGFYGGVGILTDSGRGDDAYHAWNNGTTTDYYAQGFGAFGGVGIMYEDGGSDDYIAVEIATDPFIVPLLNCAYGTGSLGGTGILIDVSGNDRYFGDSRSPYAAETMNEGFGSIPTAYGLFVDLSGDDGHFMESNGGFGSTTAGRGVLLSGGANNNIAGTYLDIGGADLYTGAAPSRDGGVWQGGADINTPVDALAFLEG